MFKNLLYFSILTTITVVSWIGFSVYHNYTTSTIESATEIRITPIPEEFDREVIEKIKNKKVVEANLSEESVNVVLTPSEDEDPESTPEAEIEL